jgi:hypothetical protein
VKTNYDNLTSFEAATVFVAIIGIGLVGFEFYVAMPNNLQSNLSEAVSILDIHEEATSLAYSALSNAGIVFDITEEVSSQFALAFSQTFSYPEAVGIPTEKFALALEEYSSYVGENYEMNNAIALKTPSTIIANAFSSQDVPQVLVFEYTPKVAGINIENEVTGCSEEEHAIESGYEYNPKEFFGKFSSLYEIKDKLSGLGQISYSNF